MFNQKSPSSRSYRRQRMDELLHLVMLSTNIFLHLTAFFDVHLSQAAFRAKTSHLREGNFRSLLRPKETTDLGQDRIDSPTLKGKNATYSPTHADLSTLER